MDGLATLEMGGTVVESVASNLETGAEVVACLRPEDVVIEPGGGDSHPTSARNHLPGSVTRITPLGGQVRVVLDCGFPLVSLITKQSLEDLRLRVGDKAVACFKASAIHLIPRGR